MLKELKQGIEAGQCVWLDHVKYPADELAQQDAHIQVVKRVADLIQRALGEGGKICTACSDECHECARGQQRLP